jgi:hypothetical protein
MKPAFQFGIGSYPGTMSIKMIWNTFTISIPDFGIAAAKV